MNWKIIASDEHSIVVENEKIKYELKINGFIITYKCQDTKNNILNWLYSFKNSHSRINITEWKNLFNGIDNGKISMESYKWFNTWIVSKGLTYLIGSEYANQISNELFGLNKNEIPRFAGEEDLQKYEYSNYEIFKELIKIIKRKFKKD